MHTPGPWILDYDQGRTRGILSVKYGHIGMAKIPSQGTIEEYHANARLIAAAPELLAALQRVYEIIKSGDNLSNEAFYGTEHAEIRAAIELATGRPLDQPREKEHPHMHPSIQTQCITHVANLRAIFPLMPQYDPLTLCRNLRKLEARAHKAAEQWCNGECTEEQYDAVAQDVTNSLALLLRPRTTTGARLHINSDPRGHALKIENPPHDVPIYRDMGGDGVVAPCFEKQKETR